jgi:hypothetical protein
MSRSDKELIQNHFGKHQGLAELNVVDDINQHAALLMYDMKIIFRDYDQLDQDKQSHLVELLIEVLKERATDYFETLEDTKPQLYETLAELEHW